MSAPAAVKDRALVSLVYVVTITVANTESAANGRTLIFCSSGRRSQAQFYAQPRLLDRNDIVCEFGGDSTATFTVSALQPVRVYKSPSTWVWYDSLHDAMKACPAFGGGAGVVINQEMTDELGILSARTPFVGKILTCSRIGQASVTFECGQVESLDDTDAAGITIDTAPVGTDLIPEAKGAICPVTMGSWRTPILDYEPGTTLIDWWERHLGAVGLAPAGFQAVPYCTRVAYNVKYSRVAWTVPGTLRLAEAAAYIQSGERPAHLYSEWKDFDGTLYDGFELTMFDTAAPLATIENQGYPLVQVPLGLSAVVGNVDEARKAVDGNPTTYATVAHGQSLTFDVVSSPGRGRIVCNSTDAGTDTYDTEGVGKPVGLKVAVLLCFPTGGTAPSGSNTVTVKFCWPSGTVWCGATITKRAADATTKLRCIQVNLPFANATSPGTPGAGWAGSKFHQWDFTGAQTTGAPDGCLYNGEGPLPFRIVITNGEASAPIYVLAATLIVGCEWGADPTVAELIGTWPKSVANSGPGASPWSFKPAPIAGTPASGYSLPSIGAKNTSMYRGPKWTAKEPTIPVADLIVSRDCYQDETDGRYTGTASAALTDPIHHAAWLLCVCAGVAFADLESGSNLGSLSLARAILSSWWAGTPNAAYGWPMDLQIMGEGTTIRQAIEELGQHCLGLTVRKGPTGKYKFLTWGPMSLFTAASAQPYYLSGAAGARSGAAAFTTSILSTKQILVQGGVPGIEITPSLTRDVINSIRIKYGPGGKLTAQCDANGSDDGTGAAWGHDGVMPFAGGLTAQAICAWSVARYGARKPLRMDLPGVMSPRVATMIGMYCLARGYRQELEFKLTGNMGLCDVEPGHVLRLDDSMIDLLAWRFPLDESGGGNWATKGLLAERSEQRGDNGITTQEISGIVIPSTIGEDVLLGSGALPPRLLWTRVFPDKCYSSFEITDLDPNDGHQDLVGVSWDNTVWVLDPLTGATRYSYNPGSAPADAQAYGYVCCVDVNSDGKKEIIWGSHDGHVRCMTSTLSAVIWSIADYWQRNSLPYPAGEDWRKIFQNGPTPGIGGSALRLYQTGYDGRVLSIRASDGVILQEYNTYPDATETAPAVKDIDGDGSSEVVVIHSNKVTCFDHDLTVKWTVDDTTGGSDYNVSTAAIADINGDGYNEVVFTGGNWNGTAHEVGLFVASRTGTVLSWLALTIDGSCDSMPTIADIDGDGLKEIVVCDDSGTVYCCRFTGGALTLVWSRACSSTAMNASPMLIDVNNDGLKEVVVMVNEGSALVLRGSDGALLYVIAHGYTSIGEGTPTGGDIDGDGNTELLIPIVGSGPTDPGRLLCYRANHHSAGNWFRRYGAAPGRTGEVPVVDEQGAGAGVGEPLDAGIM